MLDFLNEMKDTRSILHNCHNTVCPPFINFFFKYIRKKTNFVDDKDRVFLQVFLESTFLFVTSFKIHLFVCLELQRSTCTSSQR